MRNVKVVPTLALALFAAAPVGADVSFAALNTAEPSNLLFDVELEIPEFEAYKATMHADLDTGSMRPLTFFPEEVSWLPALERIQIRNRLGAFRLDPESGTMNPVESFSSFAEGDEIPVGLLSPITSSPDGRYLVFQRPESPGYASLILLDTRSGEEHVVAEEIARTAGEEVVRFSPDGGHFVYERGASVYVFPLDRFQEDRLLAESFRRLGPGSLSNVQWSAGGSVLFVVQGQLVHRIESSGLFTRSLYQDIVDQGEVVGRLPFVFDPSFDEFWVGPDARLVLLNRGGRNLFLTVVDDRAPLTLPGSDSRRDTLPDTSGDNGSEQLSREGGAQGLPFLYLPPDSAVERVLWSNEHVVTVLLTEQHEDGPRSRIRRIVFDEDLESVDFNVVESGSDVRGLERSPDGSKVAVIERDRVVVRRYDDWGVLAELTRDNYVSARWIGANRLFVAGERYLSVFSPEDEDEQLLALSQAPDAGFSEDDGSIVLRSNSRSIRPNDEATQFSFSEEDVALADASTALEDYRVFLDELSSRTYRNRILVRDLSDVGTSPLFDVPRPGYAEFPDEEDDISFRNFTHGSRLRGRQIALSINAIGGDDGLVDVLRALERYDFRATFFLTGDFIRRNPESARSIASSEHEAGNLFSTYLDLTDASLGVDERFVQEGLADTEDLYFSATGEELSLLWHAPYYVVGPDVIDAAEELGYQHTGRDVESLDSVPRYTEDGADPLYRRSAALIDRLMDRVKPGSIIDLTLGIPGEGDAVGGREDYLYHNMDVLLNALISRGYEVVPVSTLLERAQEGVQ